jgi:hypothetical protein
MMTVQFIYSRTASPTKPLTVSLNKQISYEFSFDIGVEPEVRDCTKKKSAF